MQFQLKSSICCLESKVFKFLIGMFDSWTKIVDILTKIGFTNWNGRDFEPNVDILTNMYEILTEMLEISTKMLEILTAMFRVTTKTVSLI